MTSSTFCVIPWLHRFTDEQGFHQLCCVASGHGNRLRNAQGERLHVSQRLTDGEVLNSPTVASVRARMMRGEWPEACERCRQAEVAGATSIRTYLNERFDRGRSEDLIGRTHSDGFLEKPVVRYADIRLGNVCNLTCRMCGPVSSRLWGPHYNQVQPPRYRIPESQLQVLSANNWVKSDSLTWLVEESIASVEAMHFAGGEPLIVPEMAQALEACIRSGRAREIELSYNTNLTVLPESVTSLWPHFRSVSLLCSVDGFGPVNDYIRRPSRWSDIDRNLRLLDSRFDEWKVRWATVSATVQIGNVLSINELFRYLRTGGFGRLNRLPQLVPLFDPRYLSIQALPAGLKATARRRLAEEIERAPSVQAGYAEASIGSIRTTLAYMDAADTLSDLPDFLTFSERSDKVFGDSWRAAMPELARHLEGRPPNGQLPDTVSN